MNDLKELIRDIPDFPKEGIVFKDISPLLYDQSAFCQVIDSLAACLENKKVNTIVGIESRGFIFASALAYKLGLKLALIRKKGKLPLKTHSVSYSLEYGVDYLEIHQDALCKGDRVAILDDILATGGTAKASIDLINKTPAKISAVAFLVELTFLEGRNLLGKKIGIFSLIKY